MDYNVCTTRADSLLPASVMAVPAAVLHVLLGLSRVTAPANLSPLPATLTSHLQLVENTSPLSPVFAALTRRVTCKSFACHSYKKTPGWGSPLSNRGVPNLLSVPSVLRSSAALCVKSFCSPFLPATSLHSSPFRRDISTFRRPTFGRSDPQTFQHPRLRRAGSLTPSESALPPTPRRNSFRIRTYKKAGARGLPPSNRKLSPLFTFRLSDFHFFRPPARASSSVRYLFNFCVIRKFSLTWL